MKSLFMVAVFSVCLVSGAYGENESILYDCRSENTVPREDIRDAKGELDAANACCFRREWACYRDHMNNATTSRRYAVEHGASTEGDCIKLLDHEIRMVGLYCAITQFGPFLNQAWRYQTIPKLPPGVKVPNINWPQQD